MSNRTQFSKALLAMWNAEGSNGGHGEKYEEEEAAGWLSVSRTFPPRKIASGTDVPKAIRPLTIALLYFSPVHRQMVVSHPHIPRYLQVSLMCLFQKA